MKNLKLGISALALTVASTVFAQTTSNPWLIGVGAHGVNHVAAGGKVGNVLSTAFGGDDANRLYNINNFTITPPLSKLTVARNLNKYLVLDWQTSVGNVDNKRIGMGKEFFLMTGLGLQFKFNGLWNEESWFDPYLRVGANYLRHDYSGVTFPVYDAYHNTSYAGFSNNEPYTQRRKDHFAVNAGLGSNFWITKNFGLGVQGDYVSTPIDDSGLANFWQASASLLFRFGNTDRDKDGILDKDDLCPDEPGLAQFQGCPDTDGDGVPDKDDQCPDVAGPVENNGCPWPDTDGDGILDKDDACPNEAGLAQFQGCPDTDGDGIADKDDACPTVKGPKENNGCPWTEVQVASRLSNILFEYNSDKIVPSSYDDVRVAAQILNSDDLKANSYYIDGHADQRGSDAYNKKLSLKRAQALVNILAERGGVDKSRLIARGLGEANLLCTEETEECYQKNRRVEVLPKNATVVETKVVKPAKKK